MTRRNLFILSLLSALSLGVYLLASYLTYGLGFPLDDSWIHQTYARNLGTAGEWSFVPGMPSAGSTAPLWSLWLALSYALRIQPFLWTYLTGWALLFGLSVIGWYGFRVLQPGKETWAVWAGALLALEWHLVWAATSGMETLLQAAIILSVLVLIAAGWRNWFLLGVLIGLSVWIRPDGVTLAGPVVLAIWFYEGNYQMRIKAWGKLVLGIGLLFLPYLFFNRWLAGAWWPNTFFAKQAEYEIHRQIPLIKRIIDQSILPLVGVGALLLPGFLYFTWRAFQRRNWGLLLGVMWFAGYILLYAWRLPVTYQHGRYLMPAMPVFFLWGLAGLSDWIRPASLKLYRRVLSKSWMTATAVILAAFWIKGASAYAIDVAIIETEMVATGRWISQNTPQESLIAAHDIGAIGYFGGRNLVDLAGLISPEVIPIIRDEAALRAFLDMKQADFLVTFPGWYPDLILHASPLFTTEGRFSPDAGGENMTVYRWFFP